MSPFKPQRVTYACGCRRCVRTRAFGEEHRRIIAWLGTIPCYPCRMLPPFAEEVQQRLRSLRIQLPPLTGDTIQTEWAANIRVRFAAAYLDEIDTPHVSSTFRQAVLYTWRHMLRHMTDADFWVEHRELLDTPHDLIKTYLQAHPAVRKQAARYIDKEEPNHDDLS